MHLRELGNTHDARRRENRVNEDLRPKPGEPPTFGFCLSVAFPLFAAFHKKEGKGGGNEQLGMKEFVILIPNPHQYFRILVASKRFR